MIWEYKFYLTGDADGVEDIALPISSFGYRQKSGKRSVLTAVVPGEINHPYISARSNGEMVLEIWGDGVLKKEIARANLTGITPNWGVNKFSCNLEGTKQTTYASAETPWDIDGLWFFRSPNQSDGLWTYQIAGPQYHIIAGDDVVYGDHQFTVGEVQWAWNGNRTIIYLKEDSGILAGEIGDASGADCMIRVSVPSTTSGNIPGDCYHSGPEVYYQNLTFTVNSRSWLTIRQPGLTTGFSLFLTVGAGNTGYDVDGNVLPSALIAQGGGFQYYFDPGDYNIQVRGGDGALYEIEIAVGQVLAT